MSVQTGQVPIRHGLPRWGETAASTVAKVLVWAAAPVGPVPQGSLRKIDELVRAQGLGEQLQTLTRDVAARLGAGSPPLGDPAPLGAGSLLLAASVGGRARPELAARLAAAIPAPLAGDEEHGWADAFARHAVVGPSMDALGTARFGRQAASQGTHDPSGSDQQDLVVSWLDASPLTAVLAAPRTESRRAALRTAVALADRPHGAALMTSAFSRCHPDWRVLGWRGDVLGRMARVHGARVLDVYVAALVRDPAGWQSRLDAAARALRASPGRPDPDALAVVHFWAGLADRAVSAVVLAGRLPVDLRPMLRLLERYPTAAVVDP